MQTVTTNFKTKKWVLFSVEVILFMKGLWIFLFHHQKSTSDYFDSYFYVIGGIAYSTMALRINATCLSFFKVRLEPIVKTRLLVLFGIITATYLVIWFIQNK